MKSVRERLKNAGVELESRYMIYRTENRVLIVPYYHMRTIELRGSKVIISTGGMEKIILDMVSEEIAYYLFEELQLHLERIYL